MIFPGVKISARKPGSSDHQSERCKIVLPAYKYTELDCIVGDDFGKTVIWIKESYIYSHQCETSLSFILAKQDETNRFTARVFDRSSRRGSVFMYSVSMPVQIGEVSHILDLLLCETSLIEAPVVMSAADFMLFNPLRLN